MVKRFFTSLNLLKFSEKKLDCDYYEMRVNSSIRYKYLTIIPVLIYFTLNIFMHNYFNTQIKDVMKEKLMYILYTFTGLYFICIFSSIFMNHKTYFLYFFYISFLFLEYNCFALFLVNGREEKIFFMLIICLHNFLKIIYVSTYVLDILNYIFLSIINLIFIVVSLTIISNIQITQIIIYDFLIYSFSFFVIFYIIIFLRKLIFYLENSTSSVNKMLDYVASSYIRIKRKKLIILTKILWINYYNLNKSHI